MTFVKSVLKLDEKTVEILKQIFGDEIVNRLLNDDRPIEGIITLKPDNNAIIVEFNENGHICEYCGECIAMICEGCLQFEIDEAKEPLEREIHYLREKIDELETEIWRLERELEECHSRYHGYY